jgi:DNA end-binding protein Ku
VTCPVALFPAASSKEIVRFNLINFVTNNRINMITIDAGTGERVSRADLVRAIRSPRASTWCSRTRISTA